MSQCSKKDYEDINVLEKKVQEQCKKCKHFTWFKEPSLFARNYYRLIYMCRLFRVKNEKDYEEKESR